MGIAVEHRGTTEVRAQEPSISPTAPQDRWTLGGLRPWFDRHRPEVLLVALSITLAELLTGSTPVLALIDPLADLGLLGLYGAGVLLVREFAIRWGKGWGGVLVLGMAHGVVEEGIATKTWVAPSGTSLGLLASYGRFAGINWDWAVDLTLFHAVFSIALPILLVYLSFPETRGKCFLTPLGAHWAFRVYFVTVALEFVLLDPHYFEPLGVLLFLVALALGLLALAHELPPHLLAPRSPLPRRSPFFFLLLGATFSYLWLVFYLVLPHATPIVELPVLAQVALAAGVLWCLRQDLGTQGSERHLVHFSAGLLSWYLLWAFVLVFFGDFVLPLVLLAVYWLVYGLGKRYRVDGPLPKPSQGAPVAGP